MKIRTKLLLLILGILTVSFSICGIFSVNAMKNYSLTVLADSEEEKLEALGQAIKQVGTREDLQVMGEAARDAYLKYQFKRCYVKGYGLLKNGVCIQNLTDYEILDPQALTEPYMVQSIGGKYILLVKRPLEYPEGFQVMAVKDISEAWKAANRQVKLYAFVFAAVAVCAGTVSIILVKQITRSLEELKTAASAVSRGQWGTKVNIKGNDELSQVGAAFNQMSEQVEEQVETLQLLLGALAHEMKTPVTSIIGYADSLLHVRLNKEQKEKAVQYIYQSGVRMEQMSSKLLSLIGTYENESIEKTKLSAREILEAVKEETREMRKEKDISLCLECEPQMAVYGDKQLLVSLFSNLVQNSCRASKPGQQIKLQAFSQSITVEDKGCGIGEKDLPYVTKAFYMADKSRSRKEGGSGLGLAISEKIVKLHSGKMKIESREGERTKITVIFPKIKGLQ